MVKKSKMHNPKSEDFVSIVTSFEPEAEQNKRIVEISDKIFHVIQEENHTLWTIKDDKGSTPEKLQGWYTSPDLAQQAIETYQQSLK